MSAVPKSEWNQENENEARGRQAEIANPAVHYPSHIEGEENGTCGQKVRQTQAKDPSSLVQTPIRNYHREALTP
jgi:hypothetical protein